MLPTLFVIFTLAVLYWFLIRRWMSRWGTTPSDQARVMAGDGLLVDPTFSYTMSVIVNAPPEDIWPWLVQLGYRRGGLYSYDWLDRLFGIWIVRVPPGFCRSLSASLLVTKFPSAEAPAGPSQPLNLVTRSCWI
jgi:hypothetical protein